MRSLLRPWSFPNLFPDDEEKSIRARLLLAIILSISLFVILSFSALLFVTYDPAIPVALMVFILLLNLINYRIVLQGKLTLVSHVIVVQTYLFVTGIVSVRGTVLVPLTTMYIYLIVVSGALFGKRGVWVSSAISSLTVAALMGAQNAGLLPKPDLSINASLWVAYTVVFSITGSISLFATELTRQAQNALRLANERYQLIAENTRDVIWVMDVESQKFTYVSPSVQKLRGYTPEEVMQQPATAALTPESAAIVQKQLEANIPRVLSGQPVPTSITELEQPCKDGSIVPH